MSEQPTPKRPPRATKATAAWTPPEWDLPVLDAIQAVHAGKATGDQQQLALRWIMENACAINDWAYRPGPEGMSDTYMVLGRQFVGKQIQKMIVLNPAAFRKR